MSEKEDHNAETDPLAGTIAPGGFISETPPDVDEFLTEAGLTDKAYVCTIKRAPMDGSGAKEFLPGSLKGTYMPIEDCGKRFGPGQYFYCFAWTTQNENNKNVKMFKEYKIYLGSEWDDIHDDYMAERWAKKEKDIIKKSQQKRVQDATRGIEPGKPGSGDIPDPFGDFEKMTNRFKSMGVPMFNAPAAQDKGSDNTLMMFMMKMQSDQQDRSDKMTMFMMKMMMDKNGSGDHNQMFDKIFDIFKGVVNVKELLNPEKQTVVDRVFDLANSIVPAIMEIAKKSPAQRAADPLVGVVKDSADFNKIKEDPEMLKEAIRKWDAAHGATKTDIILDTVGLKRPGAPDKPAPEPEAEDETEFEDVTEENPIPEVIITPAPGDDNENVEVEANENPME